MKHKNLLAMMIADVVLLGAGLTCQSVWAQGGSSAPPHVPGRILVKFKDGVSDGQARGLLAGRGALSTDVIAGIGVHIVQLPPNANEQAEANAFKGLANVEFAEVDQILQPQAVNPNDPFYTTGNQWALPKISLPDAWSATTGSASVRIAIVDSGIQPNHPDLLANLTTGYNSTTGTADTTDVNNHGSEVAGVAAASTNNGLGVTGVCWRCILVPVKVTDFTGAATASSIANGIIWAVDFGGARIVNASYRVNGSTTIASAADHVWQAGGILVMAAGDTATSYTFADNAHILEIGATDQNDVLYSWSSTGPYVDLVAPGCVTSTNAMSSYASNCGTSFSAPLVAGVAGLMLSINPGLTPTQIVSILKQTAVDLGPAGCDASYGCGRLNALAAVTAAGGGSTKTNTTTALTSSPNPSTVNLSVTFSAVVSPSAATGTVTFKDGSVTLGTTSVVSGIATYATASLLAGSHSITAIYNGDANNNTSTSGTLTQTVNSAAPVISSSLTKAGTVNTAFNYQITATNSPTSYGATGLPSGLGVSTATGLISGMPTVSGNFSVTINATNGSGTGSATLALTIGVAALPPAPVITSSLSASGTQNTAFSYQITATNSPTSFGASGLPSGLSVNTGSGLIYGTPTGSGSFSVPISASNSGGAGTTTLSLTISSQGTTDNTPPTAPTNLTIPGMTNSQISLAWTGSTDNVGVRGYQIYRAKKNGKGNKYSSFSMIATSSTTGYTDTVVTSGGAYQFYVKAYDAAGNVSASSNMIAVTAP